MHIVALVIDLLLLPSLTNEPLNLEIQISYINMRYKLFCSSQAVSCPHYSAPFFFHCVEMRNWLLTIGKHWSCQESCRSVVLRQVYNVHQVTFALRWVHISHNIRETCLYYPPSKWLLLHFLVHRLGLPELHPVTNYCKDGADICLIRSPIWKHIVIH